MADLAKAKELIDKIHAMTKVLSFTMESSKVEQEVAAYATLIENREPLVQEFIKLDIDQKTRDSKEFQIIKQTINDISELDKMHLEYVQEMHDTVKDAIKLVKQGQKINKSYQAFSPEDVSSRFDIKQ